MQNKYLKHISTCEGLSVDEIAARICGNEIDAKREERNASGLHAPAYLDVLLSFVALSGIGLFPTRPITAGEVGSVSTAVTTQRIGGRKQAHFVLPVISHGITLERYKGICRNLLCTVSQTESFGVRRMQLLTPKRALLLLGFNLTMSATLRCSVGMLEVAHLAPNTMPEREPSFPCKENTRRGRFWRLLNQPGAKRLRCLPIQICEVFMDENKIPISLVLQWVYCPRRAWL